VNLVLTIEKKPGRVVVEIEEEFGDLALGLWQRLGVDQMHCCMKFMAFCFFGVVYGIVVVTAIRAHSSSPVMLRCQFMVFCSMSVQVLWTWYVRPLVLFVLDQ
jgi:hypothetical protein